MPLDAPRCKKGRNALPVISYLFCFGTCPYSGSMSDPQTISFKPEPLQPVSHATARLGLRNDHQTYCMIRENLLPAGVVVRLGRRVMLDPTQLESWIAAGGAALPGGWRRDAA